MTKIPDLIYAEAGIDKNSTEGACLRVGWAAALLVKQPALAVGDRVTHWAFDDPMEVVDIAVGVTMVFVRDEAGDVTSYPLPALRRVPAEPTWRKAMTEPRENEVGYVCDHSESNILGEQLYIRINRRADYYRSDAIRISQCRPHGVAGAGPIRINCVSWEDGIPETRAFAHALLKACDIADERGVPECSTEPLKTNKEDDL